MSLAIWCQFLCIIAVSSLPMSENEVTMGRMFFSVGFFYVFNDEV